MRWAHGLRRRIAIQDDEVFRALADPSRRRLLDVLFERDGRTLTELESPLAMTRFGVMKHLRVLEEAGLITTRRAGRVKLHYLNPVPIQLIYDRWIGKYAAGRLSALADLKAALEGVGPMTTNTAVKPKLVYQMFIKAPPEKVWDALTKPEFTARWFHGSVFETDWKPGSPFKSTAGGHPIVDGRVVAVDPPKRLVYTWHALWDEKVASEAPSTLTWELEGAAGGMTKLNVIHEFDSETETYKQVSGGWAWVISSLKTFLETGETLAPPPGG